jgi:dCMP deaminase
MYITHAPCPECQKIIITSEIKRVVYSKEYTPEVNWLELAESIEVVQIGESEDKSPNIEK